MTNLHKEILDFIKNPRPELLNDLAIRVFRHQFDSAPSYRAFCEAQRATPTNVQAIDEIPMVSAAAFKYADLAHDESGPRLEFLTSGTTLGRDRRGRHVVFHPEVYRAAAMAHLRTMLFPDGSRPAMLAMHPGSDVMPESSLSTMITWCIEEFGARSRLYAASREGVDVEAAALFLERAAFEGTPVCILTTTAAFAALCLHLEESAKRIALPGGSRMMDTGGAKGQVVALSAPEVIVRASASLGIEPAMVINEYGMTELCSQLYDATAFNSRDIDTSSERVKVAPPWLVVRAIDPVALKRVPDSEPGLLAFFDLANVGSVSALMTEDIGIVNGDRVRLLGRAAASEARGCALSIGEFLDVERSRRDRVADVAG
jgi:hypothetical protein